MIDEEIVSMLSSEDGWKRILAHCRNKAIQQILDTKDH